MKCLSLVLLFISLSTYAALPENDLHLEDNFNESNVTEEQFNQAIDQARDYYAPIVSELGGQLRFSRRWGNATVNAMAYRQGNLWWVTMYGGLARRPEVTVDGFMMVVCHEIGHHLGGFPTKGASWASNEGNSDYFAAFSCVRNLWKDEHETNAKAEIGIDSYPKQLCEDAYFGRGRNAINLCYRNMRAGHSLARLLGTMRKTSISWYRVPRGTVGATMHNHPPAQCRLATYMAGALCNAEYSDDEIPSNERDAALMTCHRSTLYFHGLRPRCWFQPKLGF